MRQSILIILIFTNQFIMAQKKITKEDVLAFKESLEATGYFKYVVNKSEIKTWEKLQIEGLTENGWLIFPDHSWIVKEETGTYPPDDDKLFDYRTIMVDGDYMFRGGMEYYLSIAKQIFEIRGLKFDIRDEKMDWGENDQANGYHYFKHEVYINDKHIVIADGNLNHMGGYMYFKKYKEILENELRDQQFNESIRLLNYEDGVVMLIADEKLIVKYENAIEPFKNKMIQE